MAHTIESMITVDGTRTTVAVPPGTANLTVFGETPTTRWQKERSSQTGGAGFTGTSSYAEAKDLLLHGWPEGTARMRKLAGKLSPRLPKGLKRRMTYRPSVAPIGGTLGNIGAIAMGMPCQYIARRPLGGLTKGNKIVRICLNIGASAGVSKETIEARGVTVLALVDCLIKCQRTVDVTITAANRAHDAQHRYLFSWHVLPAGQAVNFDHLAFAMAHPSMLRRMKFAVTEHMPTPDPWYYAYGYPASIVADWPDYAKRFDIMIDSDVYVTPDGEVKAEWTSPDSQVRWIKEQLRQQGITG
jgi:hypothetical protein